jgi:hypothetical protein
MLISTSKKFIFVGINKTATNSVHQALDPYRNRYVQRYYREKHRLLNRNRPAFRHMPGRKCRDLVGRRRWESYFTFTFVRNPWARTLSEYTRHRHDPSVPVVDGFRAWVRTGGNWLARKNKMKDFVTDETGECLFDFIGRIEQLEVDWESLLRTAGLPQIPLAQANPSSNRVTLSEAYDEGTAGLVYEWIKGDLEYFGYPDRPVDRLTPADSLP